MDIKESKIGSVKTLVGLISQEKDLDYQVFFRGHADKGYELNPSIYRNERWYTNEEKVIKEMIMRCPNEFSQMTSSFEKLVKMQHYDLPTRLLDLTENPLVALYFACAGELEKNKDAEFIFFRIPKSEIKYYDSDTVSVISNLAWMDSNFQISKEFSRSSSSFHLKSNIDARKLIHNIRQEKPHFIENIDPLDLKRVICVKPKMENPRVIRQDGAFLLFGINENKHQVATLPPEWVQHQQSKKYIIKSANKPKLLRELAALGISKAKLFPEIDMVAQFIKNDYELNTEDFVSNSCNKNSFRIRVG